jgi:hypothetical protein
VHTEGRWNTDNDALALELIGEVDLVTGRVLYQDIKVWDGVSFVDESGSRAVE